MTTQRVIYSGRVQGVYFRSSTREQAYRLNLTGVARNLSDGRVEVVAAGAPEAVDALLRWLAEGPRLSRVDAVEEVGPMAVPGKGFSAG